MLDTMRGFAKSLVAKALLFFLVISFAIWGIGDVFRSTRASHVAKVGDEIITPAELAGQTRAMQNAMQSMGINTMKTAALQSEVLRRLIQQRLVNVWMHDSGVLVNRQSLAEHIQSAPEFQGLTGEFDPEAFRLTLARDQMSEAMYLAKLKDELGGNTMLESLDSSAIPPNAALVKLIAESGTQLRDVVLFTIPLPAAQPTVSPEQLKEYYEQYTAEYMQPETRTLEYVMLDHNDLTKLIDASITDDLLQERQALDKTITREQLRGEQRDQVIQDLGMAIDDGLAGGQSMGEALASAGIKAQSHLLKDVAMATYATSKDALLRGVSEQGFALNEGETSTLQSTEDGIYFLVATKSINDAAPKPFESVQNDVRKALVQELKQQQVQETTKAFKAELTRAKDWRKAASTLHLAGRELRNIARPATGKDGKVIPNSNIPPLLQQAVFERAIGEVAGPLTRDDGSQMLALVTASHQSPNRANAQAIQAADAEFNALMVESIPASTLNALAERYSVSVNQAALQQLAGSEEQ